MLLQTRAVPDLHHLPRLLHRAIPGQLPLRLRPRLRGRMPALERMRRLHVTRDLRRHDEADPAAPQFGQADRAPAAILLVGLAVFSRADFGQGPRQIAVPLQRVHRQVEMGVEDEHESEGALRNGVLE